MSKSIKQSAFDAMSLSPGLAIGPAFCFRRNSIDLNEFNYKVSNVDKEIKIFESACLTTINNLKQTQQLSRKIYKNQFDSIFESQIAILDDGIFLEEIKTEIKKRKKSAAFAINNVFKKKKEYFLNLDNEYFRDRALDIADLKQKLLHVIFGVGADYQLSVPSIVFADVLTPSDTVHFNRNLILGFVTDTGGKTSHATIMAKSLHLPSVVNHEKLSRIIKTGDSVIIDGYSGKIFINPSDETINVSLTKKRKYENSRTVHVKESKLPAITQDNVEIKVWANVEFYDELPEVIEYGGSGIGLYRTEGLFFERDQLPTEEEQYSLYKKFSQGMGNLPIIIRTIDAGGDKILKDLNEVKENNPFLGWRGIRVCLDELELFKTQLRAIFRANVNKNMKILLPMISCINELTMAKEIIQEVKNELNENHIEYYEGTEVGIMIETPAAALMADAYLNDVNFFSIGTNDLTQYTLAVDRTNMKISKLFNDLHPAVLRLIQNTVNTCIDKKKEVNICGELAGNPVAVSILIGLGLRNLSVSPILIPEIKKIIRTLTVEESNKLVQDIFQCTDALTVIEKAKQFFMNKIPNQEYLLQGR